MLPVGTPAIEISARNSRIHVALFWMIFIWALSGGCQKSPPDEPSILTAAELPAEGPLSPFLGTPRFDLKLLFNGQPNVREPYLAVTVDGTILAMRNRARPPEINTGHLRRSTDGGESWEPFTEVPFGFMDSNFIIDENTGDIHVLRLWNGPDRQWRSSDQGQTWTAEPIGLLPNEVMKWLEQTGLKTRAARDERHLPDTYYLHANASESGITLRHGKYKGRLIVTATFRPHATEHPSDRSPIDAIYSCAIFSDDHGKTWQVSGLFPEGYTEEAALAELHDGRIYFNSRIHSGYHNEAFARELRPDESLRREAWSHNGGLTWDQLNINDILPDGGGYHRGYGMKAGLVRLTVNNGDILIYSNSDTGGGERKNMTVWASFDGGETWPVKRLVFEGPAAYSSLGTGRPGTPGEGLIFLLFEGGPEHHYESMQVARFNLSWLLEGEPTGHGSIPDWIQ